MLRKYLGPVLTLAAGSVLALSLPRPGLCTLAWFAPAILFHLLGRERSLLRAAGLGGAFGFAFCLVSLRWIYDTCRFAGVAVPIALLAVTALAATLALAWALYGALAGYAAEVMPPPTVPWAWALLWVSVESACAHWTPRVAVDLIEYTQFRWLPMLQSAAVFGPHGLGFLIMLWNGALAEFLRGRRKFWPRANASFAGLLILANAAYGAAVLAGRRSAPDGPVVEILQPNIDQYRKWDERFEADIRGAFETLLAGAGNAPALVLWPESALPGWLDEPSNADWIAGWSRRLGAPMLVGAVSSSGEMSRNSAALVAPEGLSGVYHKRRLVPFGEFVPLRRWLEGSIGILAQMGDFDSGELRQPLFKTGLGPLAATICYEATFPHLVQVDAARGARVIANLTNDGWYKDTSGPIQHFYSNMFRAIENRVTVLRSANTGISGVIDPYGVIVAHTDIETRALVRHALPAEDPFPRGSFFARTGDWFGFTAMILSAALLIEPLTRGK